jgi:glycosyltransferase involved in cell wall biosynthesis
MFRDQVEPTVALRYLRASDALLVPLARDPALSAFVPSKLFDFCATGRPVVVAAAGEPQRLVGETGAGTPVPPGDAPALAGAIGRLERDPALREEIASAGRSFAALNRREVHVDRLAELLEGVADAAGST